MTAVSSATRVMSGTTPVWEKQIQELNGHQLIHQNSDVASSLPSDMPQIDIGRQSMYGIPKDYAYYALNDTATPLPQTLPIASAMSATADSVSETEAVTKGLSQAEYERALDYAKLAAQVYDSEDDFVAKTGLWAVFGGLPDGMLAQSFDTPNYTPVENYNLMDGYLSLDATLYNKIGTDEYVLSFRGTEPTSLFDWAEDFSQFYGASEQYDQALDLARQLHAKYGDKLSFTGHSLGGGLAQAAALDTGLEAICFNSAGLSQATIDKYGLDLNNAENIKHFNVQGDWISDHNEQMDDTTLNTPPFRELPHVTMPECKQYGTQYWLEKIEPGTVRLPFKAVRDFATAILNHSWHAFVYQMEQKNFIDS